MTDPLAGQRADIRADYLGDFPADNYAAAFVDAVHNVSRKSMEDMEDDQATMPLRSRPAEMRTTNQRRRTPVRVRCLGVAGLSTRRSPRGQGLISAERRLRWSPSLWHWPVVPAG